MDTRRTAKFWMMSTLDPLRAPTRGRLTEAGVVRGVMIYTLGKHQLPDDHRVMYVLVTRRGIGFPVYETNVGRLWGYSDADYDMIFVNGPQDGRNYLSHPSVAA